MAASSVRRHLRDYARRAGLGRALRLCFHRPLGLVRQSILEGGPLEQRRTARGRGDMIEAAGNLPPLAAPAERLGRAVTFLSGARYWYQTVFCFASLQAQCRRRIDVTVFDDGSLPEVLDRIAAVIPWVSVVGTRDIDERLDDVLPASRFPTLRAHRLNYPHLRKLTDLHAGAQGWTLVLDSDMLFFRRPEALLDWCSAPDRAIYMQDRDRSYGYSEALMTELSGGRVPDRVNVGLYALRAEEIDWDRAEHLCRTLLEREGPHYLHEQALTALLLAEQGARPLSRQDYVVLPDLTEGRNPAAVLHHYVAHSKRAYYQHGWRKILSSVVA